MMIETHRQIEFAAEFVGERTSVEGRRKIHRDDRALVSIDHRPYRDADAQRLPRRRG